jgi:hypothetical protein
MASQGSARVAFPRRLKAREPNPAASGNGAIESLFHALRLGRAVPEQIR